MLAKVGLTGEATVTLLSCQRDAVMTEASSTCHKFTTTSMQSA